MYSLGVILYLLFTGKFPFKADNLQALYLCHLKVKPDHPTGVNRRCPPDLGDLIMKLLSKDPKERYETCDQIRIALANVGQSRI